MIFAFLICRH